MTATTTTTEEVRMTSTAPRTRSFRKAERHAVKARIALEGPAGCGKSYTGMSFAQAICGPGGVAAIDTEYKSLSTYAGVNGWEWETYTPDSFDPADLAAKVTEAAAGGFGALVVDSLSHYWAGEGGMRDLADHYRNGKDSGWGKAGQLHEQHMIKALLSFPGHVIVTLRTKNEKIVDRDDHGAKVITVNLKAIQREGIEYEFGVVGEMDLSNTLTLTKSRIMDLPAGSMFDKPGPEVAVHIAEWLADGKQLPTASEFAARVLAGGLSRADLRALLDEVKAAGYGAAGVSDAEGNPVALADLIIAAGRAAAA